MRNAPIDLLKLDCEGSEYGIIMDPRFEELHLNCLVLEWHLTPRRPHADREILQHLRALGWQVESVFENRAPLPQFGILGSGIVLGISMTRQDQWVIRRKKRPFLSYSNEKRTLTPYSRTSEIPRL